MHIAHCPGQALVAKELHLARGARLEALLSASVLLCQPCNLEAGKLVETILAHAH